MKFHTLRLVLLDWLKLPKRILLYSNVLGAFQGLPSVQTMR